MTRREQLNQILIAHRFLLLQFTWLFVVIACAGIVKMFAEERGVGERFAKLTFVGVFFALILVPVAVLYLKEAGETSTGAWSLRAMRI
jgi:hypothetical protein